MTHFICVECGTQFAASESLPERCAICEDERQFLHWNGQKWTTLEELRHDHRNRFENESEKLTGIGTEPSFAIGQRALLLQSPGGNLLWDCITLIDDETIEKVKARGGLRAIAISHPHFYSAMVEWSEAFGNIPIYLHAADRKWVMRPDPRIVFWRGATQQLWDSMTLVNCGGHFAGASVLHWPAGAGGSGALLAGDGIQVVQDRRYVSFMRSYPNLIPLPAAAIHGILKSVEPFSFQQIFGAWWNRIVMADAKAALARSAQRYLCAITEKSIG